MKVKFGITAFVLGLAGLVGLPDVYAAEDDPGQVYAVAENIYLAVVEDRNTPFLVGDNAVLLAETNFERNAETVRNLIATITSNPVRLVVNSHWHPDHVGGNAFFAAQGALTISHDNTRARMVERQQNQTTGQIQSEQFADQYLPALTFRSKMTLRWDAGDVDLVFTPDAHTDSDVVVFYRDSNVVYIGGLLNYPMYAGVFQVSGFLNALDQVIATTDDHTKIIPWRGPVIGRAEVQEWRDLLAAVSGKVATLIAAGKSLEEVVAAEPSREFDAKWGRQRTPERFVQDIYAALINDTK